MLSEEGVGLAECLQFVLMLQGLQYYNTWCIVKRDNAKTMYSVHGVNSGFLVFSKSNTVADLFITWWQIDPMGECARFFLLSDH